mgnify:CR=1 FL=1
MKIIKLFTLFAILLFSPKIISQDFKLGKVTEAFYLNLKLLENNSIVKVESTPKIATISGHEAKLSIGETSYYFEQNKTNDKYDASCLTLVAWCLCAAPSRLFFSAHPQKIMKFNDLRVAHKMWSVILGLLLLMLAAAVSTQLYSRSVTDKTEALVERYESAITTAVASGKASPWAR